MSPDPRDEHAETTDGWRASLSRRSFLRRGTFTAAAVAVASSVPGLSTLVAGTTADAPAVDTGVSDAEMTAVLSRNRSSPRSRTSAPARSACSRASERSSSAPPRSPEACCPPPVQ